MQPIYFEVGNYVPLMIVSERIAPEGTSKKDWRHLLLSVTWQGLCHK
ncbi:hypothetical protein SAMN05216464_115139 [Mucilaginibacter pineti]|uniref:Uncharacterized protein n=1 Tax=Mucilaginibacter pineti TaxID=1391627 RepID=A0A1G7JWB2_9SPHI|nr:hypothetical protein SAMN05216464_115139 [Mucilaginibacter pineti]